MKMSLAFGTSCLPLALLLLLTSCKKEDGSKPEENLSTETENVSVAKANKNKNDLLKSVRQATSRFHSTTQAKMAGYVADKQCVSVPRLGGMGYHWLNFSMVDAVFDPLKPEAVLYASGRGGNLRLVALEYIVKNVGQARPMFGDQPLDIGGTPLPIGDHWSLHVWLYEDNPSGMFTPFNPNITCP